jgi:hypothetical protein
MFGRRSSRQDRPALQWPRQKMLALFMVCLVGASLYADGYVITSSITGNGC